MLMFLALASGKVSLAIGLLLSDWWAWQEAGLWLDQQLAV